jgi:hypothetical protein
MPCHLQALPQLSVLLLGLSSAGEPLDNQWMGWSGSETTPDHLIGSAKEKQTGKPLKNTLGSGLRGMCGSALSLCGSAQGQCASHIPAHAPPPRTALAGHLLPTDTELYTAAMLVVSESSGMAPTIQTPPAKHGELLQGNWMGHLMGRGDSREAQSATGRTG